MCPESPKRAATYQSRPKTFVLILISSNALLDVRKKSMAHGSNNNVLYIFNIGSLAFSNDLVRLPLFGAIIKKLL
jgi:hypothetical protein